MIELILYPLLNRSNITPAFSYGARSAFKLKEQDYLRSMLSRRQLQALVRLPTGKKHNP